MIGRQIAGHDRVGADDAAAPDRHARSDRHVDAEPAVAVNADRPLGGRRDAFLLLDRPVRQRVEHMRAGGDERVGREDAALADADIAVQPAAVLNGRGRSDRDAMPGRGHEMNAAADRDAVADLELASRRQFDPGALAEAHARTERENARPVDLDPQPAVQARIPQPIGQPAGKRQQPIEMLRPHCSALTKYLRAIDAIPGMHIRVPPPARACASSSWSVGTSIAENSNCIISR